MEYQKTNYERYTKLKNIYSIRTFYLFRNMRQIYIYLLLDIFTCNSVILKFHASSIREVILNVNRLKLQNAKFDFARNANMKYLIQNFYETLLGHYLKKKIIPKLTNSIAKIFYTLAKILTFQQLLPMRCIYWLRDKNNKSGSSFGKISNNVISSLGKTKKKKK